MVQKPSFISINILNKKGQKKISYIMSKFNAKIKLQNLLKFYIKKVSNIDSKKILGFATPYSS